VECINALANSYRYLQIGKQIILGCDSSQDDLLSILRFPCTRLATEEMGFSNAIHLQQGVAYVMRID